MMKRRKEEELRAKEEEERKKKEIATQKALEKEEQLRKLTSQWAQEPKEVGKLSLYSCFSCYRAPYSVVALRLVTHNLLLL